MTDVVSSSLSSVAPPRSSSIHLSVTQEHRLRGPLPEFGA